MTSHLTFQDLAWQRNASARRFAHAGLRCGSRPADAAGDAVHRSQPDRIGRLPIRLTDRVGALEQASRRQTPRAIRIIDSSICVAVHRFGSAAARRGDALMPDASRASHAEVARATISASEGEPGRPAAFRLRHQSARPGLLAPPGPPAADKERATQSRRWRARRPVASGPSQRTDR